MLGKTAGGKFALPAPRGAFQCADTKKQIEAQAAFMAIEQQANSQ